MSRHSSSRTPQAGPLSIVQLKKLGVDERMVGRLRELAPLTQPIPTTEGLSFFHVARRDRNDSKRI
jgi:hypothetical protein